MPEESEERPDHDTSVDLPGAVFMVPNSHWGFRSATSVDHPGACARYNEPARGAILVKGTDADHLRSFNGHYIVEATAENGLLKQTAFELYPRYFRLHRIRLYFPERYLGRLDAATHRELCHELARLHPED